MCTHVRCIMDVMTGWMDGMKLPRIKTPMKRVMWWVYLGNTYWSDPSQQAAVSSNHRELLYDPKMQALLVARNLRLGIHHCILACKCESQSLECKVSCPGYQRLEWFLRSNVQQDRRESWPLARISVLVLVPTLTEIKNHFKIRITSLSTGLNGFIRIIDWFKLCAINHKVKLWYCWIRQKI